MFFYYFLLTLIICKFGWRYQREQIQVVLERGGLMLFNDIKKSKMSNFHHVAGFHRWHHINNHYGI